MLASKAHKFGAAIRTADIAISEDVTFEGLLLSEPTLAGLTACEFEKPSPIQFKAIPFGRCGFGKCFLTSAVRPVQDPIILFSGRTAEGGLGVADLIAQAKSGTGKTCMFGVIALEMLQLPSKSLQVLILAPTREIAVQVADVITVIGQGHSGMKVITLIGGLPVEEDRRKIKQGGCHVVVGTPGRIRQLIEEEVLKVDHVRLVVLDEADRLLDPSFITDVSYILARLPENRQTIASSATYTNELKEFLERIMRSPLRVSPNSCLMEGSECILLGLNQFAALIPSHLNQHVRYRRKIEALVTLLANVPFKQCLVFNNMHAQAEATSQMLTGKGWPTAFISGQMEQHKRLQAISALVDFKCRVLLSTDLSSRGLDASNVDLVINLDIPLSEATYLHRVGRAGRFGTHGNVFTIIEDSGAETERFHQIIQQAHVTLGCFNLDPKLPFDPQILSRPLPTLPELIPQLKELCRPKEEDGEASSTIFSKEEDEAAVDGDTNTSTNEDSEDSRSDEDPSKACPVEFIAEDDGQHTIAELNIDNMIAKLKNTSLSKVKSHSAQPKTPPKKPPRKILPKTPLPDIDESSTPSFRFQQEPQPGTSSFIRSSDSSLLEEGNQGSAEASGSCGARELDASFKESDYGGLSPIQNLNQNCHQVMSQNCPVNQFMNDLGGNVIRHKSADLEDSYGVVPAHASSNVKVDLGPKSILPFKQYNKLLPVQSIRRDCNRNRSPGRHYSSPWSNHNSTPRHQYTSQSYRGTSQRRSRNLGPPFFVILNTIMKDVRDYRLPPLRPCLGYDEFEVIRKTFVPQVQIKAVLEWPCPYLDSKEVLWNLYRVNGNQVCGMQAQFAEHGGTKKFLKLLADGYEFNDDNLYHKRVSRSLWTLGFETVKEAMAAKEKEKREIVERQKSLNSLAMIGTAYGGDWSDSSDDDEGCPPLKTSSPHPEDLAVEENGGEGCRSPDLSTSSDDFNVMDQVPQFRNPLGSLVNVPHPIPQVQAESMGATTFSENQYPGQMPALFEFPQLPTDPNESLDLWKQQMKMASFHLHYAKYMEAMVLHYPPQ